MDLFPAGAAARDRFVLERRGGRPRHDPWRYQGLIVEEERSADGSRACTATVLLTGRECPWRCTMCDLWQHTTIEATPTGAIPAQVAAARLALRDRPIAAMKLYNAGSFFDPLAVPPHDYDAVAGHLAGLSRVVVESHPSLAEGPRIDSFLASLERHRGLADTPPKLEVAMGLETANPRALDRLNKRMSVDGFERAATHLLTRGVELRVFLLVSPPFVPAEAQDDWLLRSVDTAFDCAASVVSLVPTRPGNGALESLAEARVFQAPNLDDIERSVALALQHARHRGRIFVDLWDLDRFARCAVCLEGRRARLHTMNLEQQVLPPPACDACGGAAA